MSDTPGLRWEAHYTQTIAPLKSDWGFDLIGGRTSDFYRFDELDRTAVHTWGALFWNYKPRKGLTFTVQWLNFFGQHVVNERLVYNDLRGSSALAFDDTRDTLSPRMIKIRVVRIFS